MKALLSIQGKMPPSEDQIFCLRQRDSEWFWDGRSWVRGLPLAHGYIDLDLALAVAANLPQSRIDLLVVFPARQRSVAIPLGQP